MAIMKIFKVDYHRGKTRGISPTLFRQKRRKSNFHYLTPLSVVRLTSPLKFRGDYKETPCQATRNYLIKIKIIFIVLEQ